MHHIAALQPVVADEEVRPQRRLARLCPKTVNHRTEQLGGLVQEAAPGLKAVRASGGDGQPRVRCASVADALKEAADQVIIGLPYGADNVDARFKEAGLVADVHLEAVHGGAVDAHDDVAHDDVD